MFKKKSSVPTSPSTIHHPPSTTPHPPPKLKQQNHHTPPNTHFELFSHPTRQLDLHIVAFVSLGDNFPPPPINNAPCPWFRAFWHLPANMQYAVCCCCVFGKPTVPCAGWTIPMHHHARHPFYLFTTSNLILLLSSLSLWIGKNNDNLRRGEGGVAFFFFFFFPGPFHLVGVCEGEKENIGASDFAASLSLFLTLICTVQYMIRAFMLAQAPSAIIK